MSLPTVNTPNASIADAKQLASPGPTSIRRSQQVWLWGLASTAFTAITCLRAVSTGLTELPYLGVAAMICALYGAAFAVNSRRWGALTFNVVVGAVATIATLVIYRVASGPWAFG